MKRDPKISSLMRESGLTKAPRKFTDRVMDQIGSEPAKSSYRPLIGRTGLILIVLSIIAIVIVTIAYSEPGGRFLESLRQASNVEWKLPKISFNLSFLSGINQANWLAATVLAFFLLVLSDAGLRRRRRMT